MTSSYKVDWFYYMECIDTVWKPTFSISPE